jgi:hypothetical protein
MVIAQALLFQKGMSIVEVADEQVEFDKFVFHKLNLINRAANLPFLLLIRIRFWKYSLWFVGETRA